MNTRNGESWSYFVTNVRVYRCDTILVEQHQIRSLQLSKLNGEDMEVEAEQPRFELSILNSGCGRLSYIPF
jgi:hypothetical protein